MHWRRRSEMAKYPLALRKINKGLVLPSRGKLTTSMAVGAGPTNSVSGLGTPPVPPLRDAGPLEFSLLAIGSFLHSTHQGFVWVVCRDPRGAERLFSPCDSFELLVGEPDRELTERVGTVLPVCDTNGMGRSRILFSVPVVDRAGRVVREPWRSKDESVKSARRKLSSSACSTGKKRIEDIVHGCTCGNLDRKQKSTEQIQVPKWSSCLEPETNE